MPHNLPPILFWLGLTTFYLGERTLAGTWRAGVGGAGVGLLALALALFWRRCRAARAAPSRSLALRTGLRLYALALLALGLYAALQANSVQQALGPQLQALGAVVWPSLLLLALLPGLAVEMAIGSMVQAPTLELWRIWLAARSALILALTLLSFAAVNFAAAAWNRKIDLSYFQTTRLGSATQALAQSLTQPVQLVLFFPPGNEVLEQVRSYAETLVQAGPQLQLEVLDHALVPERAQALKVRSNGALVLRGADGQLSEPLRLDLDLELARSQLKRLDAEVYARLLRVSRPPRVAYLVQGHGERSWTRDPASQGRGVGDLKAVLEGAGFVVRGLSIAEGLGSQVPRDASLLLILGPQHELAAIETSAILQYLSRGGRALLAVDPDDGARLRPLLEGLGVETSAHRVANLGHSVRFERQRPSPYNIYTTRVTEHPITATLTRATPPWPLVFAGTSHVGRHRSLPAGLRLAYIVSAMPDSWEDADGNGQLDPSREGPSNFVYAAAVEGALAPGSPESAPLRALVLGDADCLADALLRQVQGNLVLAVDAVRWLVGDEALAGSIESEDDVAIVQRRDQDALSFYGLSFCMPALVLAGGLASTRRQQRRRRR